MEQKRFPVFAERFSMLRGRMSQEEFARFIGMSRPTVGFYENGERVPDALGLCQIAERCGVSSDWLLGLSEYTETDSRNATAEDLGLTENAVRVLMSDDPEHARAKNIVNLLLEEELDPGAEGMYPVLIILDTYMSLKDKEAPRKLFPDGIIDEADHRLDGLRNLTMLDIVENALLTTVSNNLKKLRDKISKPQ